MSVNLMVLANYVGIPALLIPAGRASPAPLLIDVPARIGVMRSPLAVGMESVRAARIVARAKRIVGLAHIAVMARAIQMRTVPLALQIAGAARTVKARRKKVAVYV